MNVVAGRSLDGTAGMTARMEVPVSVVVCGREFCAGVGYCSFLMLMVLESTH